MEILFCSDALFAHQPDEAYHKEFKVVNSLEIPYSLFNFDMLVDEGCVDTACKHVPKTDKVRLGIYRGWMLSPSMYGQLYHYLLATKHLRLINDPDQYKLCHYLPESYDLIKDYTPFTVSVPLSKFSMDDLPTILAPFGDKPIVLRISSSPRSTSGIRHVFAHRLQILSRSEIPSRTSTNSGILRVVMFSASMWNLRRGVTTRFLVLTCPWNTGCSLWLGM